MMRMMTTRMATMSRMILDDEDEDEDEDDDDAC